MILAAAWIACLLVILGCQRVRGKEDKIGEKLLCVYIYIFFNLIKMLSHAMVLT